MEDTHNYLDSLSSKMTEIKKQGYSTEFRLEKDKLISSISKRSFYPNELTIKNIYRFEGESNPSDMSILYAIETNTKEKGLVVNGYGISSDEELANFLKSVKEDIRN